MPGVIQRPEVEGSGRPKPEERLDTLRALPGLTSAGRLQRHHEPEPRWDLPTLEGRLVELGGRGALTLAAALVREVQKAREPVAWVDSDGRTKGKPRFGAPPRWLAELVRPGSWQPQTWERLRGQVHPPDLATWGIDLAGLVFIRLSDRWARLDAVETLLRSGAFGLIVVELGRQRGLGLAIQSRLAGLAAKHATAVLCLRDDAGGRSSLGPLLSLRACAERGEVNGSGPGPGSGSGSGRERDSQGQAQSGRGECNAEAQRSRGAERVSAGVEPGDHIANECRGGAHPRHDNADECRGGAHPRHDKDANECRGGAHSRHDLANECWVHSHHDITSECRGGVYPRPPSACKSGFPDQAQRTRSCAEKTSAPMSAPRPSAGPCAPMSSSSSRLPSPSESASDSESAGGIGQGHGRGHGHVGESASASASESADALPPPEQRFSYRLRVLRDKRRPGGWDERRECHGPAGLC